MTGPLRRQLGMFGAVVTGLGSILGTGVFVSIAVAAEIGGAWILLATPLAALVATFNGLSSAQLAAAHPVAGGTYEYGYRFIGPWTGFTAGWLFLVAKTASAATAAIGFTGYLAAMIGLPSTWPAPIVALAVTALVASGIRRTTAVNAVIVGVTVAALAVFVISGSLVDPPTVIRLDPAAPGGAVRLLSTTAFLFVAYTGYGRIATLGEEVVRPHRTIPAAVIVTLAASAVLYTAVAAVGWRASGGAWALVGGQEGSGNAPLADLVDAPWSQVIEVGALVAMFGVLVNLILGLSRIWLAMGRRRDMPASLAMVSAAGSPTVAVVVTGILVAAVSVVGDVRLTWGFSAFTVLLYYAITNAAALRLPPEMRRYPRWVSWAGLASCALLSVWVEPAVFAAGAGVLAVGVSWRWMATVVIRRSDRGADQRRRT